MVADLLLGVDLGTTALKAALFDLDGHVVRLAEVGYAIDRPRSNWAEQDAASWMHALRVAFERIDAGESVAAIGICGQVNTHVLVDAEGEALAPAILWQDQRCAEIAAELNRMKPMPQGEALSQRVDASSLVCRAEWFRRERPDLWGRTAYILSPKDYLTARLCRLRDPVTDPISPIGVVNANGCYDLGALSIVDGLADRMPRLAPMDAAIGIADAAPGRFAADALVVTGTMDAWASVFGSGLIEHGDAMEVAGTSEILGIRSRESTPVAGVVTFPPVDGLHLHAGPTQAGGAALQWFASVVGLPIKNVVEIAAEAPPGSGGLIFLPHLLGERAPLWDSDVRGAFIGLSSEHALPHLCRAVLEGVAYSARHLLDELEKAAGLTTEILESSGGGARSDLWCQIKADITDRSFARLRVHHSGCLGAALMAAVGARRIPSLGEAAARLVARETVFEPSRDRGVFDELYGSYRQLYSALAPVHAALAEARRRTPTGRSQSETEELGV
jgi:xylulokinase